ncbi:MAG: exodeoxyribonuclease VII small subunit [Terriglobia bacterium]
MAEDNKPKPKTDLTFEKGLERLEKIVQELERGDLPLERSLELFEEGMKLSGNCRRQLEEAENKVEILVKRAGKIVAEPFPSSEEEPPA